MLGIPPLDEIRKPAAQRGWTLRKLDKMARTGRYFQQTTRRVGITSPGRSRNSVGQSRLRGNQMTP